MSVGGWGQWGKTLGPSWSAGGEPSAPSGSEAQALGGCGEGEQEGMHRFLRCRSEEQGVKAWFLRPPYSTPERVPTGRGVQREGQTLGPGARAGRRGAKPSLSPPLRAPGCQVSCLERKTGKIEVGKKGRRKERAWRGALLRPGLSCPYPGLIRTSLSGLCPPLAFGRRAGPAGCARPLICRAGGGRRAGGLGAVCNFAASVAAVPGERAPALAPIGRRRVSWCDLLLSLLAFGHPETNQFDDY